MRSYRRVTRYLFAGIFMLGGLVHFVFGRIAPEGYEAFGNTALLPGLSRLWTAFVMPNIGWLTIAVGVFELLCGIGMTQKRFVRPAGVAMIGFLLFVTVLGYGFPTTSFIADLVANRIITIAMTLALIPLIFTSKSVRSDKQCERDQPNPSLVNPSD